MDVDPHRVGSQLPQKTWAPCERPCADGLQVSLAIGDQDRYLLRHRLGRLPKDKKKHIRRLCCPWEPPHQVVVVHANFRIPEFRGIGILRGCEGRRSEPGLPSPTARFGHNAGDTRVDRQHRYPWDLRTPRAWTSQTYRHAMRVDPATRARQVN